MVSVCQEDENGTFCVALNAVSRHKQLTTFCSHKDNKSRLTSLTQVCLMALCNASCFISQRIIRQYKKKKTLHYTKHFYKLLRRTSVSSDSFYFKLYRLFVIL
jgi:hypothetical protein